MSQQWKKERYKFVNPAQHVHSATYWKQQPSNTSVDLGDIAAYRTTRLNKIKHLPKKAAITDSHTPAVPLQFQITVLRIDATSRPWDQDMAEESRFVQTPSGSLVCTNMSYIRASVFHHRQESRCHRWRLKTQFPAFSSTTSFPQVSARGSNYQMAKGLALHFFPLALTRHLLILKVPQALALQR